MKSYHDATPGVLRRFADKCVLDVETGCWNWTGCFNSKGYPCFKVHGRSHYAHRVSHALFRGEIPDGEQVHHSCLNSKCVNPAHLESVTADANRAMQAAGVGTLEDCPI
jgi:hypothetical protein